MKTNHRKQATQEIKIKSHKVLKSQIVFEKVSVKDKRKI